MLCKAIEPGTPAIVFCTSYTSREGQELEAKPRAAAVFRWPHAKRQARIEGPVRLTTNAGSPGTGDDLLPPLRKVPSQDFSFWSPEACSQCGCTQSLCVEFRAPPWGRVHHECSLQQQSRKLSRGPS